MKKTNQFPLVLALLLFSLLSLVACSDDKEDSSAYPPEIIVEQEAHTYRSKVGIPVHIEPQYKYAEEAVFAWKVDGKLISQEPTLTYLSEKQTELFVSLEVINRAGTAYEEFKIEIRQLLPPLISLSYPEEGYQIVTQAKLSFQPEVEDILENASYAWYVNDKAVSTEKDFTFQEKAKGDYELRFVASNEDGSDEVRIPIQVCSPDELPFSWELEQKEYFLAAGRSIRIPLRNIKNAWGATYSWEVNGQVKQEGEATDFIFDEREEGIYQLKVSMSNGFTTQTEELKVKVCPPEGTYFRKPNASHSSAFDEVYTFLPAPGQFVNEGYEVYSPEEAKAYAANRMRAGGYVSLGGFGGYLVVGFDHSIENDGGYNIQIEGNSFEGSSEPGIVWVMQDENGDGEPNDTWYELKGSEYGKPETIQDYAVTYYRPKAPAMPVMWTDNQGKSGSIDYLKQFHQQDYYYPNWVETDSYTLYGTCLKSRTREVSPGYWSNDAFEWGYADNFSPIDRLTNDGNVNAGVNANHFKISDAVTHDGKPANLKYIDFVKVQTGVNAKAGWLGENSTEVFGVNDYNLIKSNSKK
mgnify:FL=1